MIFSHIIFLLSLDPDPPDAHYEELFSQKNIIVEKIAFYFIYNSKSFQERHFENQTLLSLF